jgi:hypothetical protein
VNPGPTFLWTSITDAKDDVKTTRLTFPVFAAAESMALTPLMAGMISSFSLSVVS